jgi:hypothetical protein
LLLAARGRATWWLRSAIADFSHIFVLGDFPANPLNGIEFYFPHFSHAEILPGPTMTYWHLLAFAMFSNFPRNRLSGKGFCYWHYCHEDSRSAHLLTAHGAAGWARHGCLPRRTFGPIPSPHHVKQHASADLAARGDAGKHQVPMASTRHRHRCAHILIIHLITNVKSLIYDAISRSSRLLFPRPEMGNPPSGLTRGNKGSTQQHKCRTNQKMAATTCSS